MVICGNRFLFVSRKFRVNRLLRYLRAVAADGLLSRRSVWLWNFSDVSISGIKTRRVLAIEVVPEIAGQYFLVEICAGAAQKAFLTVSETNVVHLTLCFHVCIETRIIRLR